MTNRKPLPEVLNGFKIIKDLGVIIPPNWKKRARCCIALCKKCGNNFTAPIEVLRRLSIGCSKKCSKNNGGSKRLSKILYGMKSRCYNQNHVSFSNYSKSNIFVCEEWLKSPASFYEWALSNGYRDDLTIDRIDNSKGYSPDNCRWSNKHIQSQNSSQAKLTFEDVVCILKMLKSIPQKDIAVKFNVSTSLISEIKRGIRWANVPRSDVEC